MTLRTRVREEDLVADLVARLHAKLGVEKAILFGSTARGSRLEESDIDLIVVSEGFEGMAVPERQAVVQREWNYPEDLEALTYTPGEFEKIAKRLVMREILSYGVDVSPLTGRRVCPKCGRKGSVQTKIVKNRRGNSYPYLYFAHYNNGRVSWCYLGSPSSLRVNAGRYSPSSDAH